MRVMAGFWRQSWRSVAGPRLTQLRRYGLAVVVVGVALLLKLLLHPVVDNPFLLFLSAVMISAWYGGLGPGLLAAGLSAGLSSYLFLTPHYSLVLKNWHDGLWVFLFFFEGVLITGLSHKLRVARDQARGEIAERKRAEQALAEALTRERVARAEAEAALALREHFLSMAAHELKTPLTTMVGCAQLLQRQIEADDDLAPKKRQLITAMTSQTRRMQRLAQALFDLSQLQQGALTLNRQPLDFVALVCGLVEDLRPTLTQHTVELELPVAPIIVDADEARLEQAVSNVLANAIKYSPAGGVVTVGIVLHEEEVVLAITDQGIGIPADECHQLFERFYRASNARHLQVKGLGLGLYLVKELVQAHGGAVQLESLVGQGTTVTCRLPLHLISRYAPVHEPAHERNQP